MFCRIGLGDVGEGNFALVELLFEHLDGIVGINVDRIIHLHLQDQVGSAPQIQPRLMRLVMAVEQTLARKALRNAEYSKQEYEQDCDDDD